MRYKNERRAWMVGGLFGYVLLALALAVAQRAGAAHNAGPSGGQIAASFNKPTYSSPIVLSNPVTPGGPALVWVANPDDDSITVIRTDTNTVIKKITVGNEPQGVAVDPDNTFAYVANAASNTLTVIKITNPDPANFVAAVDTTVGVGGEITTGAEPWNVVVSPDGQRVFVANSGQDTLTVINAGNRTVIGNVDLRNSICNDPDRNRHFQPRGLAVTQDSKRLFVTRFLSFTRPGGVQGADDGKEGVVCRLDINTAAVAIGDYTPAAVIKLAAQDTGFKIDANGDGTADPTSAYPNQMQSIVIRGDRAYLPNIASSPTRPLRFNVDTQAFVNIINGISTTETDGGALNMHLGARVPKAGKPKIFFANPWAIAFTNQSGTGAAYAVSAGSDGLVKLNVAADGALSFTDGVSTTTFIDLNDPGNAATKGEKAGKNPLGIVINDAGTLAYTMNYVSRNVSVVNLTTDSVTAVIKTTDLPPPDTLDEVLQVGKEIFFSSRGTFIGPPGTTVSLQNRLSSEGWQNCASCHFAGLTDGNIWQFGSGPRKSVPLNGTWDPHNPSDQRVLNYSAIFDEVQDFELNIRNVSGPGALAQPQNGSSFDPNHGLIISDTGNLNFAPAAVPPLKGIANAGRKQHVVRLPGSNVDVPALDAMKEWVRFAIRTPNGPLVDDDIVAGGGSPIGGLNDSDINAGRALFFRAGCQSCHGGGKWTNSTKDFESPPIDSEVAVEADGNGAAAPNPNAGQYLFRFLKDIGSFNLNVPGAKNTLPGQPEIGAVEKDTANRDALGIDYDGDGKGAGFNIPSLLGIHALPPYYHNGACETLACVISNVKHRTAGLKPGKSDPFTTDEGRRQVIAFLESIDANSAPPTNLRIRKHDIFFEPKKPIAGSTATVGVNVSLFGPKVPTFDPGPLKVTFFDGEPGAQGTTVIGEANLPGVNVDFSQVTLTVPWNVPNVVGGRRVYVTVDSTDLFQEDKEKDNTASRYVYVRPVPPDRMPPTVSEVQINGGNPITSSPQTTVRFKAQDPATNDGAPTSGLDTFCIVPYFYDSSSREWEPDECDDFQPLPTPNADGSFTVNATFNDKPGVAYAFVWVQDKAGNISSVPGFDVISFIPSPTTDIEIDHNEVRVFRISLNPGEGMTLIFTPSFGDIDISVFQGITSDAPRVAVSAQNGTTPESVTFSLPAGGAATTFQVEVHAVDTSEFRMRVSQTQAALLETPVSQSVIDETKEVPDTPVVSNPPALQSSIGEPQTRFLPMTQN